MWVFTNFKQLDKENSMSKAREIDQFFRRTGQSVFIEAEGKESTIRKFIDDYNFHHTPCISIGDEGIICMDENKNKWGLELRCYFDNADGFPSGVQITSNRVYRSEYPYRFNDVEVIRELFDLGYNIGMN